IIGTILALGALLLAGAGLLLERFLHLDAYKEQILAELQKSLHRPVTYRSGQFTFRFGPTFTFYDVEVLEPDGRSTFLKTSQLGCKIDLLPLLEKRVVIHELHAKQPVINLSRDASGRFNFSDLLESTEGQTPLQLYEFWMDKGTISFRDALAGPQEVTTLLTKTDFFVTRLVRGKKCEFKLETYLQGQGVGGSITIGGKARLAPADQPFSQTSVDLKLLTKGLTVGQFWPYYRQYVPFRQITGTLETDTALKGTLESFTARGRFHFTGLNFDYQPVFKGPLTPRDLRCRFDLNKTPRDVLVNALDLTIDGLNVKGSCGIRDIPSRDPLISARAVTSTFNLEQFHQYIPYGIIVKDTADWIEQHIAGGIYRLDDGRLDGRISQIVHMEKGENYNVLYIKGRVEKGVVSYGPKIPTFNNIKGELEMRGKDFILHKMAGNFGSSPMTLEGRITDYPLDTPSGYPFTMVVNPRQAEVAWLLGKDKGSRLGYDGSSTLRLTGEGHTSGYSLAGEWDLTPATYSYPDLINKPAGRANQLSFKGTLNQQEARLSSLLYNLAPVSLSLNASYPYAGKNLTVAMKTNQFQLHDVAAMLPRLAKYQPWGRLQATLQGESTGKGDDSLAWRGTLAFAGVSLKPPEFGKPISNLNGTVNFSETTLETSQLSGRLGTSTINGRGSMSGGWDNPTLALVFNSPALDLADLGLLSPRLPVRLTRVKGDIALHDRDLQIRALSGQINESSLSIKGTVQDIRNPRIDVAVTAPYLDLQDIRALTELESPNKRDTTSAFTLKAAVRADSGKLRDIDFEKLTTTVMYEAKVLYLQPMTMNALGGTIDARFRIDSSGSAPRYQVNYTMSNVTAERLTQAVGLTRQEITGLVTSSGELTARGNTAEELKRSSLGSVKLTCEDGSLRRFSVLSKIFSILNVSQLFKFQLPDMVSGGMPYNELTASFAIRDGVITSNDLFVASDAMNISAIGSINLVRDELDVTVGVQPLQTVDKVISRLPIVGWILTGKDKALITTYFTAKGKLADPQVSALPAKAMAKGVFDIFKRVFQLPAKLFTDTGEVILGK
ncbi:MAG TPA: AsmA-like C-terminal domain-containing protein, partial [Geobacteraceae bacterium]